MDDGRWRTLAHCATPKRRAIMVRVAVTPPSRMDGFEVAPRAGSSRETVESGELCGRTV